MGSKKKSLISESDENNVDDNNVEYNKPEILIKYPAIENFIENVLDTNYGIQVPALLHSIVETFGRNGITQQIFFDKDLLDWINNIIINKSKQNNIIDTPRHIGRGVGTQIEYTGENDSNKDPFTLLVPNKE